MIRQILKFSVVSFVWPFKLIFRLVISLSSYSETLKSLLWVDGSLGVAMRGAYYRQHLSVLGCNVTFLPFIKIDQIQKVSIGNNVSINSFTLIGAFENISIGDDVLIGPHVLIHSGNHKYGGHTQVSGRKDLGIDDMVKLDVYYIENWSVGLDLKIMMQTIPALFGGRGAY